MSSELHSVYFLQAEGWTPKKARDWLKKHDIKPSKRMRHEGDQLRYNVLPKEMFNSFSTKKTDDNVYLIFGWQGKQNNKRQVGRGLPAYGQFLGEQFRSTGWLSQTAKNASENLFMPAAGAAISFALSDVLRKQGY